MTIKKHFKHIPGGISMEMSQEESRKEEGKLKQEQILKTFRKKNRPTNVNQQPANPSSQNQTIVSSNTPANQSATPDPIKIKTAFIAYSDKIVKEYARDAADRKLSRDFKEENNKGFFGKIGHFFKKV